MLAAMGLVLGGNTRKKGINHCNASSCLFLIQLCLFFNHLLFYAACSDPQARKTQEAKGFFKDFGKGFKKDRQTTMTTEDGALAP